MSNFTKDFFKNTKVDLPLNKSATELPFGLYNPETEGKVSWMCDYDKDKKITGVFIFKDGDDMDKRPQYYDSLEEAINVRTTLIEHGWKLIDPPKIEFSYPDEHGNIQKKNNLSRKDRRAIQRSLKKAQRNNPFK